MRCVCRNLLEIFPPSHRMRGWVGLSVSSGGENYDYDLFQDTGRGVVLLSGRLVSTGEDDCRPATNTTRHRPHRATVGAKRDLCPAEGTWPKGDGEDVGFSIVEILLTTPLPGEMWLVEGGRLEAD
jgi:hypothetical protein